MLQYFWGPSILDWEVNNIKSNCSVAYHFWPLVLTLGLQSKIPQLVSLKHAMIDYLVSSSSLPCCETDCGRRKKEEKKKRDLLSKKCSHKRNSMVSIKEMPWSVSIKEMPWSVSIKEMPWSTLLSKHHCMLAFVSL